MKMDILKMSKIKKTDLVLFKKKVIFWFKA